MSSEYVDKGVPFLRSLNISKFGINKNELKYVSNEFHEKIKKSKLKPGDVVIVRTGKPGTCTVIPQWLEDANCSDLVIIRPGPNLDAYFLEAYINSIAVQHINSQLVGAVQQHFNVASAKKMKIFLPPIGEQKRVSGIIKKINDKIELNNAINKNLEEMAQVLFKSWFIDFEFPNENGEPYKSSGGEFEESELGLVPKGWKNGNLKDICNCFDSKRVPLSKREREVKQGAYPYYGAASLMDYVDSYLFDGVHVLMGEDGTVVDKEGFPVLQYVWGKFWVNNHAHVLKGKGLYSDEFLYLTLKRINIRHIITGAVQPKINQKNMNSLSVILPEKEIIIMFNAVMEKLFGKIRNNKEQTDILTQLRDTLLPKLMSGELRVPLGEDAEVTT